MDPLNRHACSLPGADRLAMKTGAIIVGNGEATNVMRAAGVPESQLLAVAGGDRIPLYPKSVRAKSMQPSEGSPLSPEGSPITVHTWPALHCLMPPVVPEVYDTSQVYTGSAIYECTLDNARMMTGLVKRFETAAANAGDGPSNLTPAQSWLIDRERNRYSCFDGGQIMYNFLIGDKTLLWSAHLGGYEGILRDLQPQPDVAILAIAGRPNLNGRPFDGSSAEFIRNKVKWIGEPEKIIWCIHDDFPFIPKYIDTTGAEELVERDTKSRIFRLKHAEVHTVF